MTILAVIDETAQAQQIVSLGYDLATRYDDPLRVLHVIPNEDYEEHKRSIENISDYGGLSITQEEGSAAQFARRVVDEAIDNPTAEIEASGRVGEIADEALAEAAATDPRFLVISGRRRSPAGKALFGSSAQQILLNAECPVVTIMSG